MKPNVRHFSSMAWCFPLAWNPGNDENADGVRVRQWGFNGGCKAPEKHPLHRNYVEGKDTNEMPAEHRFSVAFTGE